MFSSITDPYWINFNCQYSLSIEVGLVVKVRTHPSYNNIICLANSSETSRIVKAVRGFYSVSTMHTIN